MVWQLRVAALVGLLGVVGCQPASSPSAPTTGTSQPVWQVRFSPHGGATQLVVETLNMAKHSVLVQAYSFTSAPIAQALIAAQRRGAEVQVVLDKSQRTEQYSEADFLAHAGIPVWIDAAHAIAHNKVMIIDGAIVVTGSFNFTKAAEEHNAENVLVLRDASLAATYAENWQAHRAHSQPYTGR